MTLKSGWRLGKGQKNWAAQPFLDSALVKLVWYIEHGHYNLPGDVVGCWKVKRSQARVQLALPEGMKAFILVQLVRADKQVI